MINLFFWGSGAMRADNHHSLVIEQFTKRMTTPSLWGGMSLDAAVDQMIQMSCVSGTDTVLDVSCGPGFVTCRFAEKARHVTGIDLTPVMIDQAQRVQKKRGFYKHVLGSG